MSATECPLKVGDIVLFKGFGVNKDGTPYVPTEEDDLIEGESAIILRVRADDSFDIEGQQSGKVANVWYPLEVGELETEAETSGDEEAEELPVAEAEEASAPPKAEKSANTSAKKATSKKATSKQKKTTAKKAPVEDATKEPVEDAVTQETETSQEVAVVGDATEQENNEIAIADTAAVIAAMRESGDALSAAQAVASKISENYYTLGGILLHIERDSLHHSAGYTDPKTGFNDYVSSELGIEYRKARYYMGMYARFTFLGIDADLVVRVGWTKARELMTLEGREAVEDALRFAENNTREDVRDYVKDRAIASDPSAGRKSSVESSTERAKVTSFKFTAFEENAQLVKDALAKAGEMENTEDVSQQFLFIITEWAAHMAGVDLPMDIAVERFENTYNVTLQLESKQ